MYRSLRSADNGLVLDFGTAFRKRCLTASPKVGRKGAILACVSSREHRLSLVQRRGRAQSGWGFEYCEDSE